MSIQGYFLILSRSSLIKLLRTKERCLYNPIKDAVRTEAGTHPREFNTFVFKTWQVYHAHSLRYLLEISRDNWEAIFYAILEFQGTSCPNYSSSGGGLVAELPNIGHSTPCWRLQT